MSDQLPWLIGLSGYARSGKDTVAQLLGEEFGYQRRAFADLLRECAYALNPLVGAGGIRYATIVDRCGYEGAKETPYADEIRRTMQRLGTDVVRDVLGPDIWVSALLSRLSHDERYVITDCRFPNEAHRVVGASGIVVRVSRPGVEAANGHASETSMDAYAFSATLVNAGTIDDLRANARRLVDYFTVPLAAGA